MPVINKSPFPKTDKMGRKVPDGEAKFIDKHETETIVRDEKTGTASDDTFQAKNIPVTNFKRQSAMTYEQAAVDKVLRIHKNIAFDSRINEYLQVTEAKMTEKEKAKREDIVMSMKSKEDDFKKKYGKRAKEVMYATATKMAMESTQLYEIDNRNTPGFGTNRPNIGGWLQSMFPDSGLNPDRNSPSNVERRRQERDATERGQSGFNPRQTTPRQTTPAAPQQSSPSAASSTSPAPVPAAMSPPPVPAAMSPLPQQSTPSPRQQSGGSALPPIPSAPAATGGGRDDRGGGAPQQSTPPAATGGGRGDRGPSGTNAPTTPAAPQTTTRTPATPNYRGSAGAQAIQKENPNSIQNVNKIRAGQVIKVNGQNYTIKPGDTLDKIARNNPTRQAGPTTADLNRREAARVTTQNQPTTSASPSQSAGGSSVPRSNPSPYAPRSPMNNDQSNAPIGRPSTFPTPPTNPGQGNPRDRGR